MPRHFGLGAANRGPPGMPEIDKPERLGDLLGRRCKRDRSLSRMKNPGDNHTGSERAIVHSGQG
jgi:hypothetical protein